MSQKTKRGSVSTDEGRTESPARDTKKKVEEKASEKAAEKPTTASQQSAPTSQAGQKSAPPSSQPGQKTAPPSLPSQKSANPGQASQKSANPGQASQKSAPSSQPSQKTAPPAGHSNSQSDQAAKRSSRSDKKSDDKNKAESTNNGEDAKKNGGEAHTNGSDTVNGNGETLNGTNGTAEHKGEAELEEDERFPELEYDDGSDEDAGALARSVTRREQVKVTKTPETPCPTSNKTEEKGEESASGDGKSETKLLKLREEHSASPKQRSDKNGDEKKEETEADENGKSAEGTVKRDTNYSKSRIKVSPYRRSARLHDSMVANYTGNNTTMEMDISEISEAPEDAPLETSYASRLSIRGRRSYKQLGEFVPTPARRQDASLTRARPTVHVVGRKRKTFDDNEPAVFSTGEEGAGGEVTETPAKRVRLLNRIMTPLASLVRLPSRRANPSQIVGINTDLPLRGSVDIEPEALPAEVKTTPEAPPTVEVAVEARETPRQKCAVM